MTTPGANKWHLTFTKVAGGLGPVGPRQAGYEACRSSIPIRRPNKMKGYSNHR